MNKKIIISIIILIILIPSILIYNNVRKKQYYNNLKENIQDDIKKVLYLIYPHCEVENVIGDLLLEESQNDYYGIDKKKLLDIDGKSYCQIKAKAKCIEESKLTWKTYIKCKNYKDQGFN